MPTLKRRKTKKKQPIQKREFANEENRLNHFVGHSMDSQRIQCGQRGGGDSCIDTTDLFGSKITGNTGTASIHSACSDSMRFDEEIGERVVVVVVVLKHPIRCYHTHTHSLTHFYIQQRAQKPNRYVWVCVCVHCSKFFTLLALCSKQDL